MEKASSPAGLEAAKEGDEVELAAIIARYMPMIRRTARRSVRPGLDFDDAVQEGLIGLFAAIRSYNAAKGASFTTYAATCITNAIASAQKAAGRKKHAPLNQSVPIPEGQSIPGPEDAAIANEQLRQTLEKARRSLSSFESSVLQLYMDGFSYDEIARRLGREPKSIDNALRRMRRKLR